MLTVVVARSPVFGGTLKSFSAAKAKAVPGVREVVEAAGGVAVAADSFWSAKKGRDALEVVWDEGPLAGLSTGGMRGEYAKLAGTPGAVARKDGNPEQALTDASKQLTAEYDVPYLAHACLDRHPGADPAPQ
jgi:isoquinoline 1-oxidoreductase beta subunit